MAFIISRTRQAPVMVKSQTTTADAAPTDGTDDLLTINSPNPFRVDVSRFEIRPHGSSFTRKLDIIGQRVLTRPFTTLMAGSGTAGVEANGFTALQAVLLAAGHSATVVGATSITFKPATIAQLNTWSAASPKCGPATVWNDLGGYVHKSTGTWGNVRMAGNPTSAMTVDFQGMGLYVAPAATVGAEWESFAPPNRAVPFLNVGGTITPGADAAYTMVFKSFAFDGGADVQRVSDANSTTGLHSLLFADRNPTCTVVIAMDMDVTAGTTLEYDEIYTQLFASTTHLVEFGLPGAAGNIVQMNFNQAQLIDVVPGEENAHRTLALNYKLTHATTNEGEYDWVVT